MTKYKHLQKAYLIWVVLFIMTIYLGSFLVLIEFNLMVLSVLIFLVFILSSFISLTVTINESHLAAKFGYGLFTKKFLLQDIASVKAVKNHWYYGWGIKWWNGIWIYNVSGFDAVEIVLKNGRVYRIGTDEPVILETAIKAEIKL